LVLFRSKQQIGLHCESITTNGQSVSLSWRQGVLSDPRLGQSSYDISLIPSWSVLSDDTRGLYFVSSFIFPAFLIFSPLPFSFPRLRPQTTLFLYPPRCSRYHEIDTSRQSTLLFTYLKKYISSLEHWLLDCWIAINLWTNVSVLFVRVRDDPKATTAIFEDKWVDTADIVGQHKSGRKDGSPETGRARPFVYRRDLSISNGVLLYKERIRPVMGRCMQQS